MSRLISSLMTNDEFLSFQNCEIVLAGRTQLPPMYLEPEHSHDFWELICIEEGAGRVEVNGLSFSAEKGDVFFYPPQVPHAEYSGERAFTLRVICISNVTDMNFIDFWRDDAPEYLKIDMPWMAHAFEQISAKLIAEIERAEFAYMVRIKACMLELLSRMAQYAQQLQEGEKADVSQEYVRRSRQFIEEHYTQNISLPDIAAGTYVSVFYLSHLFKEYMGETPISYLVNLRIEKAKELLKSTELSIAEISQRVGYDLPQHFSNVFKRKVGMSPRVYRSKQPAAKE